MRIKSWLVALLVLIMVIGTGCSSSQNTASKGNDSPAKKELRPFKIGIPVSPPNLVHLPPYIALEKGYFAEQGLKVTAEDMVEFDGGLQSLRGGVSGGLDVAGTSSDPLIIAAASGGGVKGIGTYAAKLDVSMVVGPGIKSIQDLKGKKIGIQEVGGMSEVMARALLASAGMTPKDVQYVTVSTAGRVQALVTGQIDAAPLHVDQYYKALKLKSDLKVVANMWDVLPKWWYSAYMVTDAQLKDPAEREALVGFEAAIMKAQRFMYENKNETLTIAEKYTSLDKEVLSKAYDDLVKGGIWAVNEGFPKDMLDFTIAKQLEIGSITKAPAYENVIDASVAADALKKIGGKMTGDPRWY